MNIYWPKFTFIKVIDIENLGHDEFQYIRILWLINFWRMFFLIKKQNFCRLECDFNFDNKTASSKYMSKMRVSITKIESAIDV